MKRFEVRLFRSQKMNLHKTSLLEIKPQWICWQFLIFPSLKLRPRARSRHAGTFAVVSACPCMWGMRLSRPSLYPYTSAIYHRDKQLLSNMLSEKLISVINLSNNNGSCKSFVVFQTENVFELSLLSEDSLNT